MRRVVCGLPRLISVVSHRSHVVSVQRWSRLPTKIFFRPIFISAQPTPNINSMQFFPGQAVLGEGGGTLEFPDFRSTHCSSLARNLFKIAGVERVMFGGDFVTVTKAQTSAWEDINPQVYASITEHFASGAELVDESLHKDTAPKEDDSEVVEMIKELLDTRIRPTVQEDGGDIYFESFDEDTGVLRVRMAGACQGCSSSAITLKNGVENMMMHYIPEVREVVQIEDEATEVGVRAFEEFEQQRSLHRD